MPTSSTNFPTPPAHGYRGELEPTNPLTRPSGLTVAISRQAGARGGTIARKVGELLGWQVFDNETLDYLVENDSARAQFLSDIPDAAKAWAAKHLASRQARLSADPATMAMIELLLAVAARGDVVIVGRGAGYLLPIETTIHVRVVAPLESRVAYFAQWLRLSRDEATVEVRARDERRAQFLATLGGDPSDPTGYDLIVNVDRLGIEGTAQFIGWAVRTKQMFVEIRETNATLGLDDLSGA